MTELQRNIEAFMAEDAYYNQFSIEELTAMCEGVDDQTKRRILLVIWNKEDAE